MPTDPLDTAATLRQTWGRRTHEENCAVIRFPDSEHTECSCVPRDVQHVVERLLAEVERLHAALTEEQAAHRVNVAAYRKCFEQRQAAEKQVAKLEERIRELESERSARA